MRRVASVLCALALPLVAHAACEHPDQPVDEASFVTINGIEQWVTVKGQRCGNPVVLFVHGGPGNPLSPYLNNMFGAWTGEFTLVHWDQRGAGMTFGRRPIPEDVPLTIPQLTGDGVAVAEYITRHLGQRKVLLWGSSWGSILGVHMVHARPDLFTAYVGSAQLVSYQENEKASYARLAAVVQAAGDAEARARLDALGPPPWTNPRNFGVARKIVRKYEAKVTDAAPRSWWQPEARYATPQAEKDYTAGEDHSFLHFVGWHGDGMFSTVDLYKLGTRFTVPMYFVHGEEDLLSTIDVARRYYAAVTAPAREFVALPRTGHDPNEAMLAAQLRILRLAAARP